MSDTETHVTTDDQLRAALATKCEFVPTHEPWTCRIHHGVRTSLDQKRCDIARPAKPFNDAYLDNIRQAIAEGKNPASRYIVRRLLATLDSALTAPSLAETNSGLKWCGEREAHAAHDGCDGWRLDVSQLLALRDHHRGFVKRGLKYCPRCGLRLDAR